MFRPGYIQPLRGIKSKTQWYQAIYRAIGPLYPALRRLLPRYVTTTTNLGRAMIQVAARRLFDKHSVVRRHQSRELRRRWEYRAKRSLFSVFVLLRRVLVRSRRASTPHLLPELLARRRAVCRCA